MTAKDRFIWGVGTSAYQIEGGRHEGGKSESIWDRFADQGRMPESGDEACDHFHRWEEDLDLMVELGVRAYRFSVAWTRVIDNAGNGNPAGLAFYDRLVDGLVERGIEPWLTLYHWDLPQSLQDRGGWPSRDTVKHFTHYADVVSAALGDRVTHWITHNEPWVAAFLGHQLGIFAPGVTSWPDALAAAHHILLSHGTAVPVIRANAPGASVGIALDCRPSRPASDSPADRAANQHFDGYRNRWFFDPVFGRGYPADMIETYEAAGRWNPGVVLPGDLETIAAPLDFLGLNYYTSLEIAAGGEESEDQGVDPGPNPPEGYTEMGWKNTPGALTEFLHRINDEWKPRSIVITENGASYSDGRDDEGAISDHRRIDYLRNHIVAVEAARDAGVPVDGYLAWSLLDNLEWTSGFSQRFGLVWVDHDTGERVPKASFDWYRSVISQTR